MLLLSILIIIVSILLVLVVLIQNSKGGGIASNYASNTQVVGVKRQAEIIEKITWVLASALFVLCIATAAFQNKQTIQGAGDSVLKNAEVPATKAPINTAPAPVTAPPASQEPVPAPAK
jgi:preprotein translocase subunit SecG